MANNRMFIYCRGCGERFTLARFFPTPGWSSRDTSGRLAEYFRDHQDCYYATGDGEDDFGFGYEASCKGRFEFADWQDPKTDWPAKYVPGENEPAVDRQP